MAARSARRCSVALVPTLLLAHRLRARLAPTRAAPRA
jgi:hypothetical protein